MSSIKKLMIGSVCVISLALLSCGEDTPAIAKDDIKTDDTTSTAINLEGLRAFDLTPFDLNAIIYIPEKFYTTDNQEQKYIQPEIKHNDGEALWIITMPTEKYFSLEIEDWGSKVQSLATEKEEHLDNGKIYDFIYTEEGDDYMIFSRLLKSENTTLSKEDLQGMPNYHFYCVKFIDNSYVTIKTNPLEDYRLPSVKQMLNSARSLKSSNK